MKGFNTIFPRRKAGQQTRVNSKPVVLNEKTLQQFFSLPLHEAAYKLGISATAMKSACRYQGPPCADQALTCPTGNLASRNGPIGQFTGQKLQEWATPILPLLAHPTSTRSERAEGRPLGLTGPLRGSYDATLSKDAELLAETVMLLHEVRSRRGCRVC
eukprot:748020-Hanusia_phi.AAC.2